MKYRGRPLFSRALAKKGAKQVHLHARKWRENNALDAKNLLLKGTQETRTTCPPSYAAMAEGRRGTAKMSRN